MLLLPGRNLTVSKAARFNRLIHKPSERGSTLAFSSPTGSCDRVLPFYKRWPAQCIKGYLIS